MVKATFLAVFSLLLAAFVGCGTTPFEGPFGPPMDSPLLKPYQGRWVFDFEKTLSAAKAAGATDDEIARTRRLYAENPRLGKLHPDLTIRGNEAVGSDLPASEYRLFALHRHGSRVCGKAWHHEDRHDPGDMSKCYVRLELKNGDLYMDVNSVEGLPIGDPDLNANPHPPVEGGLSECDADKEEPNKWSHYVFSRGA